MTSSVCGPRLSWSWRLSREAAGPHRDKRPFLPGPDYSTLIKSFDNKKVHELPAPRTPATRRPFPPRSRVCGPRSLGAAGRGAAPSAFHTCRVLYVYLALLRVP